ncbi:MAG: hypothetical protein ABIN35_01045 [candidate division WOR-3 bacterium]
MEYNWDVDTWKVLDSYFSQNKILTQHQLESFNNMIDFVIPQIIEKNNPLVVASDFDPKINDFRKKLTIHFGQIYISKPLIHENDEVIKPLYPREARLRGLTYASPMFIDIHYQYQTQGIEGLECDEDLSKSKIISKIPFMKLPIMVHSKYCYLSEYTENSLPELGECEYDQGGYFIVNGGEKVIISQERIAENQVFVWAPLKSSTSRFTHEAEIKSSIDQRFYPVVSNKVMLNKESTGTGKITKYTPRALYVAIPYFKEPIPLFILFRALGIATEKEMIEMIIPDYQHIGPNYINLLKISIDEARNKELILDKDQSTVIRTQDDALIYLSDKLKIKISDNIRKTDPQAQLKYVQDILNRELFPHIGYMSPYLGQTFRKKAFFLGYMTRRLLDCYFGVRPYDDRDHYGNKRVDLAGPLLTKLFRFHFIRLLKEIKTQMLSQLNEPLVIPQKLRKIIQSCNIDSKIKYGLSTGNWMTQKTGLTSTNKGIAQVLNRMTFAGTLSHTRRIQSPLERAGSKIVPPRRLHGSHYGMCCPNETPEGQHIGIVKNLAMQTHITIQTSDYPIRIILKKLGVMDLIETIASDVKFATKIFINGEWYGIIHENNTKLLYDRLRILKRHGIIVPYISISWFIDWREIHIQTDGGRYTRPVYIVDEVPIGSTGPTGPAGPTGPTGQPIQYQRKLLIEYQYQTNPTFRQLFVEGKLTWQQLIGGLREPDFTLTETKGYNGGVIEYLDVNEITNAMIAMTYQDLKLNSQDNDCYLHYTHCEIHPMMMMGIISANIPFSDHNQSPRNCYQCLSKDEEVIMADGSQKKISEIKVGEWVITVNPNTMTQYPSKVINQYVKPTDKKMVQMTTISGRQIICTYDHPILTQHGWKNAGSLTHNDLICVTPQHKFYPLDQDQLILDQQMLNQCKFIPISKINLVQKLNLLPLYQNSPSIPLLARLCGLTLLKGRIQLDPEMQITIPFDKCQILLLLLDDLKQLGLNQDAIQLDDERSELTFKEPLSLLIYILNNLNHNDQDTQTIDQSQSLRFSHQIPQWVKDGSLLVKRAFLSSLQLDGGEFNYCYNDDTEVRHRLVFGIHKIKIQTQMRYKNQLLMFATDLKNLYLQFGVKIIELCINKVYQYLDQITIEIVFEPSEHNIYNYFENIGYRYDNYKYQRGLWLYEYLKSWHFTSSQSLLDKEHRQHFMEQWDLIIPVHHAIFEPLWSIQPHQNVEIADITIESPTHSFITGQHICVHNSSMAKQSIGYYVTNYNSRMDTLAHVLVYGQKPLVQTRCAKYTILDKLPHGVNSMLLYACYTGYNQEDSVIVNRDSVERGFFNTIFFRTYLDKEQKHRTMTSSTEQFINPLNVECFGRKHESSYHAINDKGAPIIGHDVNERDVIIGKIVEIQDKDEGEVTAKDASTTVRNNEYGIIDMVISEDDGKINPYNSEGHRIIKARVSTLRQPEIGDKFACFDDKTQILTDKGWKQFKDLLPSDRVASLDHGCLVYSYPLDIQVYNVTNQPMYTIKTQQISLKVTPNHRLYVKTPKYHHFIIDEAQNLFNQTLQFQKNCQYRPNDWCGETFTISMKGQAQECCLAMEHWLRLYGMWITQGLHVDSASTSPNDKHLITIVVNKTIKMVLDYVAKETGWIMVHEYDSKNNVSTCRIDHAGIKHYLYSLNYTVTHKYLPEWVWSLNQHQSYILLNSICLFNLSMSQSAKYSYQTMSSQLANDLQRLALHAGLSANLLFENKGNFWEHREQYVVEINLNDLYHRPTINDQNQVYIDKVDQWENYTGKVYCCTVPSGLIYVRRQGIPVWIGNSRCSQKGTVGILYRSIDLPFNCYGWVPDIIMNPHGIPSRMTIGKLLETLLGRIAVNECEIQDATPFIDFDFNQFKQTLRKYGMDELGNEVMYNGQTGQMDRVVFFYGPTYYQRLKHMVLDKIHSRESGPVQLLTRQPAEGRSRDGGLRIGEMERDVLIAHGIPKFLKEKMTDASDLFRVYVSKKEETIITGNAENQLYRFGGQNIKNDEIMEIQIPYAMKLLMQELESMGIDIRLTVK